VNFQGAAALVKIHSKVLNAVEIESVINAIILEEVDKRKHNWKAE
jgi:hypothetical protein